MPDEKNERQQFEENVSESLILKGAQNEVSKLIQANKVNRRAWQILAVLLAAVIILGSLFAIGQYHHFEGQYQQTMASQQAVGKEVIGKLCVSFGRLNALQPPSGSAGTNPSRAYEQQLHAILGGVYVDIGCPTIGESR